MKKKDYKIFKQNFKRPLRNSNFVWKTRESLVIREVDDDGKSRYGEIAPTPGFNTLNIIDLEKEAVRWRNMDDFSGSFLLNPALSCMKSNIWSVEIGSTIDLNTTKLVLDYNKVDFENQTIKKKIGLEETKIEISKTLEWFERLPDSSKVRLDPNQALNLDEFRYWVDALRGNYKLEFMEQPLRGLPSQKFIELIEESSFPVALDEAVVEYGGPRKLKNLGWQGFFIVKPTLLEDWDDTIEFVRENPESTVISTVFESPFGYEAVVRLSKFSNLTSGIDRSILKSKNSSSHQSSSKPTFIKSLSIDQLNNIWEES